jgi:hypothetical protein
MFVQLWFREKKKYGFFKENNLFKIDKLIMFAMNDGILLLSFC